MPALDDFTNEELDSMAAAIEAGTAPDELVRELAVLLAETPQLRLEAIGAEEGAAVGFDDEGNPVTGEGKTALGDLIEAVEEARGPVNGVAVEEEGGVEEPPEPLEPEAESAVRMVERLLSPTAGRDPDFFFGLREALETGDASFSGQVNQETIDAIPADRRQLLADRADDLARSVAVSDMTRADFPRVEDATERRQGRTVVDYWRPLLRELEAADPEAADILRGQGVSGEQLEALFANSNVLNEFIEKVQQNIEGIQGTREGAPGPSGPLPPGTGERIGQQISARVRQIVPNTRRREDPISGETFSADPQLERAFLEWVINIKGDTNRFDALYFRSSPERRRREFIPMQAWARLQVTAGNASVSSATGAGLPEEWFEGLG